MDAPAPRGLDGPQWPHGAWRSVSISGYSDGRLCAHGHGVAHRDVKGVRARCVLMFDVWFDPQGERLSRSTQWLDQAPEEPYERRALHGAAFDWHPQAYDLPRLEVTGDQATLRAATWSVRGPLPPSGGGTRIWEHAEA